jgi:hypothetical protein
MREEGSGVYKMLLINPTNLMAMTMSPREYPIVRTCAQFLASLDAQPPPLCLLCDTELVTVSLLAQIMLIFAAIDRPKLAVAHGICMQCEERGNLEQRVAAYYRENVMSDFRTLPPLSEAGSA